MLARAALTICRDLFSPDILHCHDWQAGMVPTYLHTTFANDPTFMAIRTLFTIHNIGYQGILAEEVLPRSAWTRLSSTPPASNTGASQLP